MPFDPQIRPPFMYTVFQVRSNYRPIVLYRSIINLFSFYVIGLIISNHPNMLGTHWWCNMIFCSILEINDVVSYAYTVRIWLRLEAAILHCSETFMLAFIREREIERRGERAREI